MTNPLVCGMSFDSLPAWLWSFRLSDWSAILITDADEHRLRQFHVSTWSFWKDKFEIVKAEGVAAGKHNAVVWFASGSRSFLEEFESQTTALPVICWLERSGRRRPADSKGGRWFSVSHELVGGSTTARGVFGAFGLTFDIDKDPLKRTLAHVLKYSERPSPCSIPVCQPHYTLDDRLSLNRIAQPVLFQSGFSRTGWGIRQLIPSELSQAFDLPAYLEWNDAFPSTLVPVQLLRVTGDAALQCLRDSSPLDEPPRAKVRNGVSAFDENVSVVLPDPPTWFPLLRKWLPGSWAHASISSKAVKSDNAQVDQLPWNLRITLLFPTVNASAIRGFEALALRRWRTSLSGSFFRYLRETYGGSWLARLQVERRRRRKAICGWKRARFENPGVPKHGLEVKDHGEGGVPFFLIAWLAM